MELPRTPGFYRHIEPDSICALAGSSIQNIPSGFIERYDVVSSRYIFNSKTAVSLVKPGRVLNQYVKQQAAEKWIVSASLKKEFNPNHSMYFSTDNICQKAASLPLEVSAKKIIYKAEVNDALLKLQNYSGPWTVKKTLIKKYLEDLGEMEEFHSQNVQSRKICCSCTNLLLPGQSREKVSLSLREQKPSTSP